MDLQLHHSDTRGETRTERKVVFMNCNDTGSSRKTHGGKHGPKEYVVLMNCNDTGSSRTSRNNPPAPGLGRGGGGASA